LKIKSTNRVKLNAFTDYVFYHLDSLISVIDYNARPEGVVCLAYALM